MKVCFSCVVDQKPLFRTQSLHLLASIKKYVSTEHDIVFHLVGEHPKEYLDNCLQQGVIPVATQPFPGGVEARFCNKLQQLQSEALKQYDIVFLCDADIVFTADIAERLDLDVIQAKYVDTSTPALPLLLDLAAKAGLPSPTEPLPVSTVTSEPTLPFHCNGGLYIIPQRYVAALGSRWGHWAAFALANLPSPVRHHADQVAFSFTMLELGLPFAPLSEAWNYPLHFAHAGRKFDPSTPINVLHYHDLLDESGSIRASGISHIDMAVAKANQAIDELRQHCLENMSYWDYRYTYHQDIGSGTGSRGEYLSLKRSLLYPLVSYFRKEPILDVGCGDLEVMQECDAEDYTGIDLSEKAIQLCKEKRCDWTFLRGTAKDLPRRYSLSLCLDVLIHVPSIDMYRELVTGVLDYTTDTAIFSGYERPPVVSSAVVFFHEPLSQTLRSDPRIGEITLLGTYRECSLFMAQRKKRVTPHPNDISLEPLANMLVRTPDQQTAMELVQLSRSKFGFFSRTATRVIEYPWIVNMAGDVHGKSILDVGAGITPLPLWFAQKGAQVVTTDLHPRRITRQALPTANEWGFFDYAALDSSIQSFNMDAKDLALPPFDIIYSCSAIEHISKKNRVLNVQQWAKLMNRNGQLLLTVDLVPKTRRLWNFSENKLVDAPGEHGTIDGLLTELSDAGFKVKSLVIESECFRSRTDIAMIEAYYLGG